MLWTTALDCAANHFINIMQNTLLQTVYSPATLIPRTSRRCFSTVFQRWSCGKAHAAWWCKFRRQTKPLPACPSCTTFPKVGPPAQGWPSGNKAAYADCIASYSPCRPVSAGVLRNINAEHQNLCMECLMCTCWRSTRQET